MALDDALMALKKRIAATALALLGCSLATQADEPYTDEPLKVGFVYVSPIGDAGWTYMHDQARQIVAEEFGDKIETSYVESVAEGSDSERVIRNLSARGHDLIFTTSFGYMNPTLKVARRFPNVKYEHATGYKTARNVGNYQARAYQGRYLAGMTAGAMSESGRIGYVAAFPIPEVIRGINAFTLGVQTTNPDARVSVVWINTWHDPAREREAADSLILQGADVLTMHSDSPAVIQAAEARNVYAVGFNSDMSHYGPNAHLTAVTMHWESIYHDKIQAVLDGNWESTAIWHGLKEGVVDLSPFNEVVPQEVVEKVTAYKMEIIEGTRQVFQGPLYNQAGEQVVAEGDALSDSDLLEQEWFVNGVDGKLNP
ncbi:BMP family ABC transporter substrate-binding protein [Marinimicrobium sp. ARAG 43.8]|uniref:BMP family ABC transporter substrate-binding protein n=1 Tax=Marinimicrobium sp. ARAG 43.8 TaxID=3418719 RepID=UPI003CED7E6A